MAQNKTGGSATGYRVFVGLAPKELPLAISRTYDFSAQTSYLEDLQVAQEAGQIEWVQALFCDNSQNAQPTSFYFPITNQTIVIAPYSQAYVPVLSVNPPKITVSSAGGVIVNVSYMNFAVPSATWPSIPEFAVSDNSGTITTGGTAQTLFGGAIPANGFAIYNPDASNDLFVSDSTTAVVNGVGSIRVPANGGAFVTPTGVKPMGVVSIIGATTGGKFTARKW